MYITKILESTIPSGGTSATFTDSDIPNSLIRVFSTNSDLYPLSINLSGNVLTVTYEAVSSALGVAVELVKDELVINDTLTSTATDEALSANQGKNLKDLIDAIVIPTVPDELNDLNDVTITSPSDGQFLVYDNGVWVNTTIANAEVGEF